MKKNSINDSIFVGSFVSKEYSLTNKLISQAGNNFQLRLVELLNWNLCYSFCPIFIDSNYNDKIEKTILVKSKFTNKNNFTTLLKVLHINLKLIKIIFKKKNIPIFFYNIDLTNLFTISVLLFFRKSVFIILADNPNYKNKTFFDKLITVILKSSNGILSLSSNSLINSNQIVQHGFFDYKKITFRNKNKNKNVLFSGSIGLTTGISLVLDAFSELPDYTLHVTGRPYHMDEKKLVNLIDGKNINKNIIYHGLLNFKDYDSLLYNCDIALSTRNPDDKEHSFNFPSKIIEYLSNSLIVISTMTYNNFHNEIINVIDFDKNSLKEKLIFLNDKNTDYNKQYMFNTQIVREYYSDISLEHKITKLINHEKN